MYFMYRYRILLLAFFSCMLLLLSTATFAAEEKLAIIKKNTSGRGVALQVYNPPTSLEGDTGSKVFEEVNIGGSIADLAANDIDGIEGDELAFIAKWNSNVNSLHLYTVTPEASLLRLRLLAHDWYLGTHGQFIALCNCDNDHEKEAAVIRERRDGNQQLKIYDLPLTRRGNAEEIASISNIGKGVTALSAGDMDDDGKDELVIARKNSDNTFQIGVYSASNYLSDALGLPSLSYSSAGRNIIPNGLAIGNFDADSEEEIAIVRLQENANHSLEIAEFPTAANDKAITPIASDTNIGTDILAITSLKIAGNEQPHNSPPQAVIEANPLQGLAPLTVTLDGSNSRDSDGSIQEYRWEFDGGQAASGPSLDYTYETPGTHTATLTVVDNKGAQDSTQISMQVQDPAADAQNPVDEVSNDGGTFLPQEQKVINLVNQERQKHGLSSLTPHSSLTMAAKRHSQDMAENNFFSHTGSDGSTPFTRMREAGYQFRTAGENIAAGYSSPQAVFTGWMNSDGHRRNILNPNYCELGVGYVYEERSTYRHYWTLTLGCR